MTKVKGWKAQHPRQLKKIVTGLNETTLNRVVKSHENRGWVRASEVKEHGYGLGILMIFKG
ncbi:hypothetical protein KHA94_00430 [Bacillus sp. FJAT-49705]|uniref:Uncharacterized protein n=1 Tax=Cytobacillus citreus TaxID=2833586 RepID=A0ABS5NLJ2_9BACI|nr:hypothetical protein [Cytobacillus citreus]MBS4188686.1 hypothetical protein [Cytobacillus citreus]